MKLNNTPIYISLIILTTLIILVGLAKSNSISLDTSSNMLLAEKKYTVPKGWFTIVGITGLCVSTGKKNGRLVQKYCGNKSDEGLLWKSVPYLKGHIIINKSGSVMHNKGEGKKNGNPVLGYKRNNSPAQIWDIKAVHHEHFHFRNLQVNKCLDDSGNRKNGRFYSMRDCGTLNKQQWFELLK